MGVSWISRRKGFAIEPVIAPAGRCRRHAQTGHNPACLDRLNRRPAPSRSIPQREPVLARFHGADEHAALPVDLDDLAAAEALLLPLDLVAAAGEVGADLFRNGVLEPQYPLEGVAARRVRGLLRVAAAVE